MKIYPSNNPEPVNSVQRKPNNIMIPPFTFKGFTKFTESQKWYPRNYCEIVGGYVTAGFAGPLDLGVVLFKKNIFEQGAYATIVASAIIPARDTKSNFTLANPLGGTSFSPYDWMTVVLLNASGHREITVQMYADQAN